MSDIGVGSRVRYQDIACKGIGYVRAVNPHNKALVLVEVEEKDRKAACLSLDEASKDGYSMAGDAGTLRMFWLKELEKR